ncbi:MAG: penicillin-binding protein 1B, partial [Gammaproteobacteria bacterium]|nr:penicillin-binding protein 1B [Gammaproteobacteria bacterium]
RDSWFAGFSEDKLAVVWVGNDDNLTTGLTGAGGALNIWSGLFQHIPFQGLELKKPDNVDFHWIDRKTGLLAGFGCDNTIKLPFLNDRRPMQYSECE